MFVSHKDRVKAMSMVAAVVVVLMNVFAAVIANFVHIKQVLSIFDHVNKNNSVTFHVPRAPQKNENTPTP